MVATQLQLHERYEKKRRNKFHLIQGLLMNTQFEQFVCIISQIPCISKLLVLHKDRTRESDALLVKLFAIVVLLHIRVPFASP